MSGLPGAPPLQWPRARLGVVRHGPRRLGRAAVTVGRDLESPASARTCCQLVARFQTELVCDEAGDSEVAAAR